MELYSKILNKHISKMIFPCFLLTLVNTAMYMVDTALAGHFLGSEAIAAVGIASPVVTMLMGLICIIAWGLYLELANVLGRGDKDKFNKMFSSGMNICGILSIIASAFIFLRTGNLVKALAGNNTNQLFLGMVTAYLRSYAPSIIFTVYASLGACVLSIFGFHKQSMIGSIINLTSNIVSSTVFVLLLPDNIKMVGLGLGSTLAAFLQSLYMFAILFKNDFNIHYSFSLFKPVEFKNVSVRGFIFCIDLIIDSAIAALINKIIMNGFNDGVTALASYHVVFSVFKLVKAAAKTPATAVGPFIGILYGERDRKGIQYSLNSAIKFGVLSCIIWGSIIIALANPLMSFYGMKSFDIKAGIVITSLLASSFMLINLLSNYFQQINSNIRSLIVSIIPDSIVYPALLYFTIKSFGYYSIWFGMAGNGIISLSVMYLIYAVICKRFPVPTEKLLSLDSKELSDSPMLSLTIKSGEMQEAAVSEKIFDFLSELDVDKKTANYAALCLEEIAADFAEHCQQILLPGADSSSDNNQTREVMQKILPEFLNILVIRDKTQLDIIIKNTAKPYNPLDFDYDPDDFGKLGIHIVQKIADSIQYIYAYRMNIIKIRLKLN